MADGRQARGLRWIEQQRSPRYDIWVSNTQVAAPWLYHPDCMTLWDTALGRPMTQLHGQPAGDVFEDVARAAKALRARPPIPWSRDAAKMLEFMRHLCGCWSAWSVRVETPVMVSCFELVEGVLSGAITRDQALCAACERDGTEADARAWLNWAKTAVDYADPARRNRGPARTRRRDRG
jgi:hypothetical protein